MYFFEFYKIKHEYPEETKVKESACRKHKKTADMPIGGKLINSLKKYISSEINETNNVNDNNNKKNINANKNNTNEKLRIIGKTKSLRI